MNVASQSFKMSKLPQSRKQNFDPSNHLLNNTNQASIKRGINFRRNKRPQLNPYLRQKFTANLLEQFDETYLMTSSIIYKKLCPENTLSDELENSINANSLEDSTLPVIRHDLANSTNGTINLDQSASLFEVTTFTNLVSDDEQSSLFISEPKSSQTLLGTDAEDVTLTNLIDQCKDRDLDLPACQWVDFALFGSSFQHFMAPFVALCVVLVLSFLLKYCCQ